MSPGGPNVGLDSTRQLSLRSPVAAIRKQMWESSTPQTNVCGHLFYRAYESYGEIKSTFLAERSTAKPHGLTESGAPEKRPVSPRSGGGPSHGADGHFFD